MYFFIMSANIQPIFADDKSQAIEDINQYMEWQGKNGSYIFSKYGMIDQLEADGYLHSDAVYAVENCGVDWNEIAYKVYSNYMQNSGEFVADSMMWVLDFSDAEIEYAQARYRGEIPAPSESITDDPVSEEDFSFANEQEVVSSVETEEEYIAPNGFDIPDEETNITDTENESEITDRNEKVVKMAESYLKNLAFSEKGLIQQLKNDGFSNKEALYGAYMVSSSTDWNEQAAKKAESYLHSFAYSEKELISMLEKDGFTHKQAIYGASVINTITDNDIDEQVIRRAESYLTSSAFSEQGLIRQLESDGFTTEKATYGVNAISSSTDWKEQAAKKAKSYLQSSAFSERGLVKQLEFEGFTHDQAVYGVNSISSNVDWNEQAGKKAESYLRSSAFSERGLIRQLEFEGFTYDQAVYGASESSDIDWNNQAAKEAESYLNTVAFSEKGLIRQLESNAVGFTHEQAVYGVNAISKKTDWNEQAVKKAKSYLQTLDMSRSRLIHQLEFEGFTHEQAIYGADHAWATSEDMVEVLQLNMDNIFPIRSLEDKFTTPVTATYSDVGKRTAVQTSNQDGMRHILLFANADSIHDYNVVTKINAGNLQNFMFTMEILVNDVYPANQGGCFIGYTNTTTSAVQTEEATMIGLLVNDKGAGFYNKPQTSDSGSYAELSYPSPSYRFTQTGTPYYSYKLTLIRLTGQTFAYVNDKYIGQFNDNSSGPYQLVYGTTVFNEGDTASCSFDNLAVRKVLN